MDTLRVVIADDERPAREFLKSALLGFEFVEVVGEADNGSDAVELIRNEKPDLALLDLQMPEMSGIDVVKTLRKSHMPLVAFVTAYDEFAVKAFELNAVDYLLKPVEAARLSDTLHRAIDRLESTDWRDIEANNVRRAAETYDDSTRSGPITRIPVKVREEIILIPIDDIASIIAHGELLQFTTHRNQTYTINHRLKDLEPRLDEGKFVRLSRGALVNVDVVKSVSPMPGGTYLITLRNGQEIQASRIQSKILRAKLLKL